MHRAQGQMHRQAGNSETDEVTVKKLFIGRPCATQTSGQFYTEPLTSMSPVYATALHQRECGEGLRGWMVADVSGKDEQHICCSWKYTRGFYLSTFDSAVLAKGMMETMGFNQLVFPSGFIFILAWQECFKLGRYAACCSPALLTGISFGKCAMRCVKCLQMNLVTNISWNALRGPRTRLRHLD